ncbi:MULTISPECIES: hypothetical protein [Flavobacterium]|uniref:Uncharacterized protein n=1 Tax=Flavobacterium endoglycinae TaxID=2816357 RepID=A0ABX7QH04_9FLAO|nr:hypothetical protein [Flavobacterium endoglycinae]QSW90360.1 hypothetical protein J0383_05985 [Flavobacterium endoglycinae]
MKKKISVLILIFGIVLTIRLFCGVYEHDEFAETNFFIKHRPTWKWRFYSPIGMSDMKIEELSKERQIEQQYFNEFITDQGLSR